VVKAHVEFGLAVARASCLLSAALLLALAAAEAGEDTRAPGEPAAPLKVMVFYSKEDPRWPNAQGLIADSVRPYGPRVVLEQVCLDDPAGYARLAQVEKQLPVERPGELTVVAGNFALTSQGAGRRDVENYIAPVLARMLGGAELKQRRAVEVADFARQAFQRAQATVEKEFEKLGGVYFRVAADGVVLGWVVDAYRTIQCPVCYDAQFLVAVTAAPELKVRSLRPVRELELYGQPLPADRVQAFLRQFEGRTPATTNRVDGVVGATKTGFAYERAVNEILVELQARTQRLGARVSLPSDRAIGKTAEGPDRGRDPTPDASAKPGAPQDKGAKP